MARSSVYLQSLLKQYNQGKSGLTQSLYNEATTMGNARGTYAGQALRSGPERLDLESQWATGYDYYKRLRAGEAEAAAAAKRERERQAIAATNPEYLKSGDPSKGIKPLYGGMLDLDPWTQADLQMRTDAWRERYKNFYGVYPD